METPQLDKKKYGELRALLETTIEDTTKSSELLSKICEILEYQPPAKPKYTEAHKKYYEANKEELNKKRSEQRRKKKEALKST